MNDIHHQQKGSVLDRDDAFLAFFCLVSCSQSQGGETVALLPPVSYRPSFLGVKQNSQNNQS